MKKKLTLCAIFTLIFAYSNVYGFDNGFIWSLKANFSGTFTTPMISKSDLDKLGASYMKGGMGFFVDGEAELGYLFGSKEFFNAENSSDFSGMSAYVSIGVGQGSAIQQSGAVVGDKTVDVYFNVSYTPVINFGIGTKVYFFDSKFAIGLLIGGKIIADMSPSYEFYSSAPDTLPQEVGTLIITPDMIKRMNPVMGSIKLSFEYNQPILEKMEIILGLYGKYNIYHPGYITMPPTLASLVSIDLTKTPMKSYFINSFDFGISLGVGFKA